MVLYLVFLQVSLAQKGSYAKVVYLRETYPATLYYLMGLLGE